MKKIAFPVLLLICVTMFSCARYEIYPVSANSNAEGLRYYGSSPYVFVSTKNDSTYDAEIKFLPDMTREFRITRRGFIGKADLNATILDGWNLNQIGTTNDPQISETLNTVVSSVLTALLPTALAEQNTPQEKKSGCPTPCIFRLVQDTTTASGYRLVLVTQ